MGAERLDRWTRRLPRPDLEAFIATLRQRCRQAAHLHERLQACHQAILQWIGEQEPPTFCLPGILSIIRAINEEGLTTPLRFQMSSFEGWLGQRSGLTSEQEWEIRARIMGQALARSDYERLFPIGQGRVLPTSHIVTAHSSPDLDTTISSFWAWCDAWAAKIAERLHYWNVPGGLPALVEIDLLLRAPFGPQISELPKARSTLVLTAFDLLAKRAPPVAQIDQLLSTLPVQSDPIAILDASGTLVGELRQPDVDRVRQLSNPFMACLHWFERYAEQVLVDFLAQNTEREALQPLLDRLFALQLMQADPFRYETGEQQQLIAEMVRVVWQLADGEEVSFGALADAIARSAGAQSCRSCAASLATDYIRAAGDSSAGYAVLATLSHALAEVSNQARHMLERLDQVLRIKELVLHIPDQIVSGVADVEELLQRMGERTALLSALVDDRGHRLLEGMVLADDLRRQPVGTVSLRDFCNREEVQIPSYFEVASVVDHHKAVLQTSRPATALLADVQSVNTLIAEQALLIQEPWARGGLSKQTIEQNLEKLAEVRSPSSLRRQQRLLSKLQAWDCQKDSGPSYWVAPERQWWQGIQTLFAILDDTDLLTKVTWRDLHVSMRLVNLLESLDQQEEVEVVAFDDLPCTPENLPQAAQRLLEAEPLREILAHVLHAKERAVNSAIEDSARGKDSPLFADCKILNRCASVGQIKLFEPSHDLFDRSSAALQALWLQRSQDYLRQHPEVDLYLEMISSIPSLIHSVSSEGSDQLWIWVPPPEASRVHLRVFLANLAQGPLSTVRAQCRVLLLGRPQIGLQRLYEEYFQVQQVDHSVLGEGAPFAVLEFPKGLLNSRKATITPCLPTL